MKIALVTGASGVIGPPLIHHLMERGYRVRAFLRPSLSPRPLPKSVETVQGEITDYHALGRAVHNVDTIFHLAAQLHIDRPSPALQGECVRINVEGTRRLVEVAQAAGIGRFIFFSTINVYGSSQPNQLLTEDSPLHPDSLYAETKIQGERFALTHLPAVILRLAAVYGPGMKGNYVSLVNALRKRRFLMIGDGRNRRTLIHSKDVCKAAVLAAEKACALGQIFNVTDGHVHTLQDIITAMCTGLGQRAPRFHLPVSLARFTADLLEAGMKVVGRNPPIRRAMIDKIVQDIAVSGDKIQRQLGYKAEHSLVRGWCETIDRGKG